MSIKYKFIDFFKRYRFNSVLFVNFIKIFAVIMVFVCFFVVYIYQSLFNAALDEFINFNKDYTNRIANSYDVIMEEIKYMTYNLSVDTDVNMYVMQSDEVLKTGHVEMKLMEKLKLYKMSIKYIDSIYIYSDKYGRLCNHVESKKIKGFSDMNWYENYKNCESGKTKIFVRKINNVYPRVITFLFRTNLYGCDYAIVVNVDTVSLDDLINKQTEDNMTDTYIIDENNNIIYSKNASDFCKPIYGYIAEIINNSNRIIKNNGQTYIGEVRAVKNIDWKYVCVTHLNNYSERMKSIFYSLILLLIALAVAGVLISFILAQITFKPVQMIVEAVDDKKSINYHRIKDNEIKDVVKSILLMVNDNEKMREELQRSLSMYNKLQMIALQNQVNPHFINNTLNMINIAGSRIYGRRNEVSDMIVNLTRLLRYSYISNNYVVELSEELEFLRLYTEMLYQRYKNFEVIWDIAEETKDVKYIRCGLQIIVENAIYHGLREKEEGGFIRIKTYTTDENVFIEIKDNGKGIDEEALSRIRDSLKEEVIGDSHFGIRNVYHRLRLMFGEKTDMSIDSKVNVGTEVVITIPKNFE